MREIRGALLLASVVFLGAAWAAEGPVPEPPDPFRVPDGSAEELLTFIEGLQGRQPPAEAGAAADYRRKQHAAVVKAAEKVLSGQPTDLQAEHAVRWKVLSLGALARLDDADAAKRLEAFPAELVKAGRAALARRVHGALLHQQLREAMTGGKDIGQTIDRVKRHLAEGPVQKNDAGLAMMATRVLEMMGKRDLAAEAYRSFGKLLVASDDPEVSKFGAKMEGAARRVDLVGKPLKLEGAFLDGKPLDWNKYRGNVVLVQFWATWCGPCRTEMESIRKSYEQYHAKGFEVLGISCDDNRSQLEEFVKEQKVPWKTLFSDDPAATGMDHPMATHYGVMGIPELLLVGRDGNVVSMQVRGPRLRQELEKLLGPVPEKEKEKEG